MHGMTSTHKAGAMPCTFTAEERAAMAHVTEAHKIIAADFAKNHQGREYSEAHAHAVFDAYAAQGGEFLHLGKVLVFHAPMQGGGVEFHCMNGGSGQDLTSAVNAALEIFASRYKFAATYYDNPRINDLMKFKKYPVTVTQLNGGIDRTFEARFTLQGAAWVQ